jgi:hypothetical protein
VQARRAFFLGLRRVADRALRFGFGIDVAAWAFLLEFILHDFLRLALFPVRFIFLLAGEDHVFGRCFLAVNISADFVGSSEKLFHVCFHFRYPTLYDARFDVVRLGLGEFVEEIFFGWLTT